MKIFRRYKQSKAQSALLEARNAVERGHGLHAQHILENVIKSGYYLKEAWLLLAETYSERNKRFQCFEQVLKIDPENTIARKRWEELFTLEVTEQKRVLSMRFAKPSLSRATYIGQEAIKDDLIPRVNLAKSKGAVLDHLLFSGPDEMGKATLAQVIAEEINVDITPASGSEIKKEGEFAAILTNLREGDVLLIKQIDLINPSLLSMLSSYLENTSLDIILGKGPSARSLSLKLPKFTIIGTTSRPSQVDKKISRWFIFYDFLPYSTKEIGDIVQLLAQQQGFKMNREAATLIAEHSEGLPGHAAILVKRIGPKCTSYKAAREALSSIGYVEKPMRPMNSIELADYLKGLSGSEFEEYIAKLFRKKGYRVELTKSTGDHGIDLLVERQGDRIAIQCKRWSDPVGEKIVRDFYGSLIHAGERLGYIIATTTFSSAALTFAEGKSIYLFDLDALIQMIIRERSRRM